MIPFPSLFFPFPCKSFSLCSACFPSFFEFLKTLSTSYLMLKIDHYQFKTVEFTAIPIKLSPYGLTFVNEPP